MALTICLLGAGNTGKTTLSQSIAASLRASGHRVAVVPEVLRAWCEREGRAPRPEEQLRIAQLQEQQVDEAAAGADVVIADTSALMVAIHAGMPSPEGELLRFAIERQRCYATTLVTGLDLPWVADGLHREGPALQASVDAQVRAALQQAGIAFRVVYGEGEERTRNALAPVLALLGEAVHPQRRWTWACDKCGDPTCEHRLFTALRGG